MKIPATHHFNLFRFLFTVLVIFCYGSLYSKTLSKTHYTTDDGLPSSEVYCSYQDNKGFVWFGTDRGVARFDGKKFKIFTTEDGLTDNVVFSMKQDEKGRLWFNTYRGGFCYYKNGQIYPYQYNAFFDKWSVDRSITFMYYDSLDNMMFGYKGSERLYKISNTGKLEMIDAHNQNNHVFKIKNNILMYRSSVKLDNQVDKFEFTVDHEIYSFEINAETKTKIKAKGIESLYFSNVALDTSDQIIYCSIRNYLFKVTKHNIELIGEFNSRILSMTANASSLIIGLYKGGYAILDKESNELVFGEKLYENSVSSVKFDKDNSLWLTTLEDGVFYVPQIKNLSLTLADGLTSNYIINISGNHKNLVLLDGLGNVNLYPLKNNAPATCIEVYNTDSRSLLTYDQYRDVFYINRYDIKVLKDEVFAYSSTTPLVVHPLNQDSTLCFRFSDSTFYFGYLSTDYKFNLLSKINNKTLSNARKIFRTNTNRVLIGSLNGLYELKDSTAYFLGARQSLFKSRINTIANFSDYDFVVATRDVGLILVKENKLQTIGEKEGLLSNQITALSLDHETGSLWLGTSKGISILKSDHTIINLKQKDGLLSEEINDIYLDSQQVYAATKKGVTIIDKSNAIRTEGIIPVYFESLKINDSVKQIVDTGGIEIPYSTNFLEVNCVGVNFLNTKNLKYGYRLKGEFDEWQTSKSGSIVFTNLIPGIHYLEIFAFTDENLLNSQSSILKISVLSPFWQTYAFKLLIFLCLILLLILFFRVIISRVEQKNKKELRINTLKMGALNAQMNPHFIFNALNSVQNFIMKNDKKEANRFLSKFSKLMRKILTHSEKVSISLYEEIQALTLYLDLEKLRFDNQISYYLKIDPFIDQSNVLLPTLLLQPIVENSIWHGLRPKKGSGRIKITIANENDQLIIVIEDDGVGINFAIGQKKRQHQSKGVNLVKERIDLFSQAYNTQCNYKQQDLSDISKLSGTRVTITLPFILKNNESINY